MAKECCPNGYIHLAILFKSMRNPRCTEGTLWEKKFEVYCIENNIPIWTPVINQSHEDYLVKMLHEIVPVNVKYRKINSRGRFELKLTSRKINYLSDTDIKYIALVTDVYPDEFFFIDLDVMRRSEKIDATYPSISLSTKTIRQYSRRRG